MKIFTYNFKYILVFLVCVCIATNMHAQKDTTFIKRIATDTSNQNMNMDAVYSRPFLSVGKLPVAIGGYVEANTIYSVTNGISNGFSFQMRRMSLFFSSTIAKKIKFMSELEFEEGAKEINIEYAAIDIELHPLLNFRGGVVLNPIGAFNQNHDGPKWDFVDRPLSATTLIPSTLSSVGFGLHGKYFAQSWVLGYETYLTNGFDDKIISNADGRTSLADGNVNPEKFVQTNSGLPMFTGKLAASNHKFGEFGVSYMTGVYNTWKAPDGLIIDSKRSASVFAIDFNTSFFANRLNIRGELAKVWVEVPDNYIQTYGTQQLGCFVDFVGTIIQRPMLGWDKARINLALRLEYVDYNQGTFRETGGNIYDDIWQVTPGIAFRPVGSTVLRFNYVYSSQRDILGNSPAAKTGTMEFGISSYF
jgi:hypothetical protein